MSRATRLANHIERTVTGPMWHGPALLEVLDGVDAARARARPIAGAHSIWEIVLHVTAWADIARQRIQGEATRRSDARAGLAAGVGAGVDRWAQAVERLKESHRRLAADVRLLDDAALDARVKDLEYPVGILLRRRRRARDVSRRPDRAVEESMTARYFKTAAEFRRWLAAHHASERELLVGFYKKASGKPGISYKEAVDEALCFGWIDGVKKRVDEAALHASLHAAQGGQHLEPGQHEARRGADRAQRDGDAGARGVEAARSEEDRDLLVREPADGVRRRRSSATFKADAAAWTFFRAQPPGTSG